MNGVTESYLVMKAFWNCLRISVLALCISTMMMEEDKFHNNEWDVGKLLSDDIFLELHDIEWGRGKLLSNDIFLELHEHERQTHSYNCMRVNRAMDSHV